MEAPFPDLADVPSRPQASTTPKEREALRTQLERRRDEINRAAASLLRGGTEPVPVSLESQLPRAPSGASTPPPPLPGGLPPSPERPAPVPDQGGAPEEKANSGKSRARAEEDRIEAPGEADMPPARAAGEQGEEDGDEAEPASPEEKDGSGN